MICDIPIMPEKTARAHRRPTLQDARRGFARDHICRAARDLFFVQGYAATTFEQIAQAAGTRRTTLYSHFADKADILAAIGEDYHVGLRRLVETLPGPVPSRSDIDAWIQRLVAFVIEERTPASLLIGLGVGHDMPPALERISERFREDLAGRLPAFAHDGEAGDGRTARLGRAKLILRELSLGCLETARDGGAGDGPAVLATVAELLEHFVQTYR